MYTKVYLFFRNPEALSFILYFMPLLHLPKMTLVWIFLSGMCSSCYLNFRHKFAPPDAESAIYTIYNLSLFLRLPHLHPFHLALLTPFYLFILPIHWHSLLFFTRLPLPFLCTLTPVHFLKVVLLLRVSFAFFLNGSVKRCSV